MSRIITQIDKIELSDVGQPLVERTSATLSNGTTVHFSPKREEGRGNWIEANTAFDAAAGKDLSSVLVVKNGANLTHVDGAQPYGNSNFYKISNPKQVQALAANLGLPPAALDSLAYEKSGQKVSSLSLSFSDKVTPEEWSQHNHKIAMALEDLGLVPNGAAYALKQKGLVDCGGQEVAMELDGHDRLLRARVDAGANATGREFTVTPIAKGQASEIRFGKMNSRDGRYMVSDADVHGATKIAQAMGVGIEAVKGRTMVGLVVHLPQSADQVMLALGDKGIVSKDVAADFAADINKGDVKLSPPQKTGRYAVLGQGMPHAPVRGAAPPRVVLQHKL